MLYWQLCPSLQILKYGTHSQLQGSLSSREHMCFAWVLSYYLYVFKPNYVASW